MVVQTDLLHEKHCFGVIAGLMVFKAVFNRINMYNKQFGFRRVDSRRRYYEI